MSSVDFVQQILDGHWQHASAARQACRDGTWAAFVRKAAPTRPALLGRRNHARCVALAERAPTAPFTESAVLVPLWGCVTAETPADEWVAVHGVLRGQGGTLEVQEGGPFFEDATPRVDALFECEIRRWKAGIVVRSDVYDSSVPMRLRAGAFAVLEHNVDDVVSVAVRASAPLARPLLEVPSFARWFRPRVMVAPDLERAIEAICFTASIDGD